MAHLPTVIEELREDERVIDAYYTWLGTISVFYKGGRVSHTFNLNDLPQMTNEQVKDKLLKDINEVIV